VVSRCERSVRTATVAGLFALAGLGTGTPAHGGTISIATELTVAPKEGVLAVTLGITNSGDEAAAAVVPNLVFAGQEMRGEARHALGPHERMQASFDVPWTDALPGQWPLVTRIGYTDAHAYPFEAVQVSLVTLGTSPALVALVDVSLDGLEGSGTLRAKVKSLSPEPLETDVRIIVPQGLEADPTLRHLALAPWADAEVTAGIVNRSALAGSTYPVFVTLEYADDVSHHAAMGYAMAHIQAARALSPWYAWSVAITLMAAWALVLLWRRRAARPAEPA
jgi:hypothetical protein